LVIGQQLLPGERLLAAKQPVQCVAKTIWKVPQGDDAEIDELTAVTSSHQRSAPIQSPLTSPSKNNCHDQWPPAAVAAIR
jgi:hypothetical protein